MSRPEVNTSITATETWVGPNVASRKERNYTRDSRGVYEYTELWTGKNDDSQWPNYANGQNIAPVFGNLNLPNCTVYSVNAQSGQRGPLASYVMKASNKFDPGLAKWSASQGQEQGTVVEQKNTVVGSVTIVTFISRSIPWFVPVVEKTSYHLATPNVAGIGTYEAPPNCPFSLSPNAPPGSLGTWGWVKTNCDPSPEDPWVLKEAWRFMATSTP